VNATLIYDGAGRREKKTINGSLTQFLYDGVNPVQETSGATALANILTGLGTDEFLSRTDVVAGTTSHFLRATLSSTVALADNAGVIQTEYTYEPFGKSTVTGASNSNPFQFTGRENDGTGLYYYRARYSHPTLQRFLSEDPIEFRGGDVNLYAYVVNNPIRFTDPHGLFLIPFVIEPVFRPGASPWDTAPDWHRNRNMHQRGVCPPSEPNSCDHNFQRDHPVLELMGSLLSAHPGFTCYRGKGAYSGAQCCYKQGKLGEGEGTYDYSPPTLTNPLSIFGHIIRDVLPGKIFGDYAPAGPQI
jgi:RHS repeat-associated protein